MEKYTACCGTTSYSASKEIVKCSVLSSRVLKYLLFLAKHLRMARCQFIMKFFPLMPASPMGSYSHILPMRAMQTVEKLLEESGAFMNGQTNKNSIALIE